MEAVESLIMNAMLLESHGLEQTDWSASGFKVIPASPGKLMHLKAVDLGNVQKIEKPNEDFSKRLARVLNIKGSFHGLNGKPELQVKLGEMIDQAYQMITREPQYMAELKRKASIELAG